LKLERRNNILYKMSMENKPDVVKRKKGRPRKIQTIEEPKVEAEKKKRGRKKKEVVAEEIKPKKKRGRKAAVKYFSSSIRKQIPLTTVFHDNNNYILHLDTEMDEGNEEENDVIEGIVRESTLLANEFQKINLETDTESDTEGEDEITLKDEYENRLRTREIEDKLLVDKLEELHNNDSFIDSMIYKQADVQCLEDLETNESERERMQSLNRKKGYFEVLYKFIHNDAWLEKTDVSCWWCCHNFTSMPIGVPVDFVARIKKFRVKGIFCSFACMIAYAKNQHIFSKYLVRYFYCKLTGEPISDTQLPCAPPRCALKMFGGELNIDEFRKKSKENTIYKMIDYPLFISRDYVQEVDTVNMRTANIKVFEDAVTQRVVSLDEKRVKDAKMRLSEIEKNTVTIGNTIDKFIKFS
jgi:hypothetical protein